MPKRVTGFYRSVVKSESDPSTSVDPNQNPTSGNPQNSHTHANMPVLDQLGVDQYNRLTKSSSPINPPLLKEQW